jgi:murein L,D-transpeptidase YcbB/YkuD
VTHRHGLALSACLLLTVAPPALNATRAGAEGAALRAALAAPQETCPGARLDRQELARFYPTDPLAPLWVDARGPGARAQQLRAALERAEEEGLPRARYGIPEIDTRWPASAPAEQACLDLLLTAAFHA